jgi:hypothetical protein
MKTNFKKSVSLVFLSFFVLLGMTVFAQKANFSGKWTLNEGKSQLGEGQFRMAASKMNVTQDEKTLALDRIMNSPDGQEMTTSEKYTLDGKECQNTGFMEMVKKSTVTFSADNKVMTISSLTVFEREGNKMEIKAVEIFKISEDGKTITIDSTSTSPRGERKTTLVYEKAK